MFWASGLRGSWDRNARLNSPVLLTSSGSPPYYWFSCWYRWSYSFDDDVASFRRPHLSLPAVVGRSRRRADKFHLNDKSAATNLHLFHFRQFHSAGDDDVLRRHWLVV